MLVEGWVRLQPENRQTIVHYETRIALAKRRSRRQACRMC